MTRVKKKFWKKSDVLRIKTDIEHSGKNTKSYFLEHELGSRTPFYEALKRWHIAPPDTKSFKRVRRIPKMFNKEAKALLSEIQWNPMASLENLAFSLTRSGLGISTGTVKNRLDSIKSKLGENAFDPTDVLDRIDLALVFVGIKEHDEWMDQIKEHGSLEAVLEKADRRTALGFALSEFEMRKCLCDRACDDIGDLRLFFLAMNVEVPSIYVRKNESQIIFEDELDAFLTVYRCYWEVNKRFFIERRGRLKIPSKAWMISLPKRKSAVRISRSLKAGEYPYYREGKHYSGPILPGDQ